MLNNFETNEFHGDSVALERKRVSSVLHLRREEWKTRLRSGKMEYLERTIFLKDNLNSNGWFIREDTMLENLLSPN